MKTLILILSLVSVSANAASDCRKATKAEAAKGITQVCEWPKGAPKCNDRTHACLSAWYSYGDETGDYGPIDAAE